MPDNERYKQHYSESKLWNTLSRYAKKAGNSVVLNVLKLYYAMALGKATPRQIVAIIAVLGYLIAPADAIPDLLPGGLLDDSGMIALAVSAIAGCTHPEVVAAAEAKLLEWFEEPTVDK